MKILGIETSSNVCSVAILEDNKIIKEININDAKTHSIVLMPIIEELLNTLNIKLEDIDVFTCSIGPGSFTGIRIGIATVMAMKDVFDKTTLGIPSLLGLAHNISDFNGTICSLIDARNNNVYCGVFDNNKNLLEPYFTDSIDNVIQKLKLYSKPILFVGDGAVFHKDILQNNFNNCCFAEGILNNANAVGIAKAALYKENFTLYSSLSPMYLKLSQAERNL